MSSCAVGGGLTGNKIGIAQLKERTSAFGSALFLLRKDVVAERVKSYTDNHQENYHVTQLNHQP